MDNTENNTDEVIEEYDLKQIARNILLYGVKAFIYQWDSWQKEAEEYCTKTLGYRDTISQSQAHMVFRFLEHKLSKDEK